VFPRDIACLRNMSINTLHKGDDNDDNDNNNRNYYYYYYYYYLLQLGCHPVAVYFSVRNLRVVRGPKKTNWLASGWTSMVCSISLRSCICVGSRVWGQLRHNLWRSSGGHLHFVDKTSWCRKPQRVRWSSRFASVPAHRNWIGRVLSERP